MARVCGQIPRSVPIVDTPIGRIFAGNGLGFSPLFRPRHGPPGEFWNPGSDPTCGRWVWKLKTEKAPQSPINGPDQHRSSGMGALYPGLTGITGDSHMVQ
jgi:hypothetical protein